jgi:hypothetical protein
LEIWKPTLGRFYEITWYRDRINKELVTVVGVLFSLM